MRRTIRDITDFIFLNDAPSVCDIILVPGSREWEHVETAARMYRQGFAKYVIPCGRFSYLDGRFQYEMLEGTPYYGKYGSEAEYYKHILIENGVPESAIICEDRSQNTFENAIFAEKLLREKGILSNRIMLCCKSFHARRAFMTFERYFSASSFVVVPTDAKGITRENWFKEESSFLEVMSELEKCGRFFNDMYPLIQNMRILK